MRSGGTRYEIRALLGQGGFGKVYLASMEGAAGFRTTVALKALEIQQLGQIRPDEAAEVARRTRDEARLLGMLSHRGIVRVLGLVRLAGRWTTVMEFLRGVDVLQLSKERQIPPAVALAVVSEAAAALHYAWHHRPEGAEEPLHVLHRDIKPSNLLITDDGRVVLLDFGAARGTFAHREAETRMFSLATAGYAAPERDHGQNVPAGDIFSLGVVLWEMLCRRNYQRRIGGPVTHASELAGKTEDLRETLGEACDGIPELVADMVAYEPHARPSAEEVHRRAEKLRTRWPAGAFSDWVTANIPDMVEQREPLPPDEHVGKTYSEEPISEEDFEPRPARPIVAQPHPGEDTPAPEVGLPPPPRLDSSVDRGLVQPDSATRRAHAGQVVPAPPAPPEADAAAGATSADAAPQDDEDPTDPGRSSVAVPAGERATEALGEATPEDTETAGAPSPTGHVEPAPQPPPVAVEPRPRRSGWPVFFAAGLLAAGLGATLWWGRSRPEEPPAGTHPAEISTPPVARVQPGAQGAGQAGYGPHPVEDPSTSVEAHMAGPVEPEKPAVAAPDVAPAQVGGSAAAPVPDAAAPVGTVAAGSQQGAAELGSPDGAARHPAEDGAQPSPEESSPEAAAAAPATEERVLEGGYQCHVGFEGAYGVSLSGPESDGAPLALEGDIPAGTWNVEADFGGSDGIVPAGTVTIPRGLGFATVVCQRDIGRCRLEQGR